MAASKKRLDLRFGAFACSVQGFDDPVMPVQQILRAIQHLLEESPEIADAGISFDADTIESLVEEVSRRADINMSDLEITPGLVIIYHGEGNAAAIDNEIAHAARAGAAAAEDGDDDEAAPNDGNVSDIFAARLRRSLDDVAEDAETVIEGAATGADAADGGEESPGGQADIFAAPAETGGGIFHDPMAAGDDAPAAGGGEREAAPADDGEPAETFEPSGVNLFGSYLAAGDDADSAGEGDAGRDEPAREDTDEAGDEPALELGPEMAVPGGEDDPHSVAGIAKLAGAEAVDEMMVCAAAWLVLLKGQTVFSRRDVLDAFDQIPGDHPKTLEARIKGFGKAVRNRQIVMLKDGEFRLSGKEVERFQGLL